MPNRFGGENNRFLLKLSMKNHLISVSCRVITHFYNKLYAPKNRTAKNFSSAVALFYRYPIDMNDEILIF